MGLDVLNLVDIRAESNYELAMRLQTSVANDDFYTDLNGFQARRPCNGRRVTARWKLWDFYYYYHYHKACRRLKIKQEMTALGD